MRDADLLDREEDADFRPFFDMVIGILFVLLILVAALIFFQQVQDNTVTSEAARQESAIRRAEIAAFLGTLADRLRGEGLDATVDLAGSAVLLPLHQVVAVERQGLPGVEAEATARLGRTLTGLVSCVSQPRNAGAACAAYDRLHLDALDVRVSTGALPPGTALPRDRFGRLASALLSAALLRNETGLLQASDEAGQRVMAFDDALAGSSPAAAPDGPGGDVVLSFAFR